MYKISFIVLVIALIISSACKVAEVPEAYKFKPREVRDNLYGSWTEVTFMTPGLNSVSFVSGELLAMSRDSMYLLMSDGHVQIVGVSSIATEALCTHKAQTGRYFVITLLYSIPSVLGIVSHSEYASEFLSLGSYIYGTGFILMLTEGSFNQNYLIYPKKHSLLYFNSFARYPAGLPENIDYSQLTIKRLQISTYP